MSTRDKSCFLLKTKLKALERLHIKQVIKRKAIGLDVGKTYKKKEKKILNLKFCKNQSVLLLSMFILLIQCRIQNSRITVKEAPLASPKFSKYIFIIIT